MNPQIVIGKTKPPWKKKVSFLEKYYSTGKFTESIPMLSEKEIPEEGSLRRWGKQIWQYNSTSGGYEKFLKLFDENEIPEGGEFRLHKNTIYEYNSIKNTYKQVHQFPSKFIRAAKPPVPSPLESEYWKQTLANVPTGVGNLLSLIAGGGKGRIVGGKRQTRMDFERHIEEVLPTKKTALGKAWETVKVPAQFAAAPAIMAWNVVTKPFKTLHDKPVEFLFGVLVLKGGTGYATNLAAKHLAKGYIKGEGLHKYIESIPDEALARYGVDPKIKQEIINKVPPTGEIPLRSTSPFFSEMKKIGQEPFAEPKVVKPKVELAKPTPKVSKEQFMAEIKKRAVVKLPKEIEKPLPRGKELAAEIERFKREGGKIAELKSSEQMLRKKGITQRREERVFGEQEMEGVETTKFYSGLPVDEALNRLIDWARPSALGRSVMKRIVERRARIAVGILEGEKSIIDITKGLSISEKLSKKQMESIPYVREGLKDTSVLKTIGREDLIPFVKNPSKSVMESIKILDGIYKKDWAFMRKYYNAENFVDNYVSQIWEVPKGRRGELVDYYKRTNPFLKKRKFETLEEGIKMGFKPRTTNISEIYRIYNKYKYEVAANVELANTLKSLYDETGNPLIITKNPPPELNYVPLEHPVFGEQRTGWIHPEIYNEIRVIWERPKIGKLGTAYDTVNAFLKYSQLSITLFHHGALSESALGAGLGFRGIAKAWSGGAVRTLKGKPSLLFEKMEIAKDGVAHGLRLAPSPDVQIKIMEDMFRGLEKNLPKIPSKAIKGVHKGFNLWNRFLWEHMHNTYKLWSYEKMVFDGLKSQSKFMRKKYGRTLNAAEVKTVKQTIAQFVNDSFGGQNWDFHTLLGNPTMRRGLQRLILAPDWTVSVFRQASALARGPAKTKLGKALIGQGNKELGMHKLLEGRTLTRAAYKYWARMAAYFMLITQGINRFTTQKFEGKAKWTWENDPGAEYRILVGKGGVGKNREGEPKIYLRFGKQFTEPMRYILEPEKIFGAKLSPALRTMARQVTKHDPGTGWPTAYAEEDTFWKRVKDIVTMPIPFSLKGKIMKQGPGQFLLMYPLSRGMTRGKTQNLFEDALKIKDDTKRESRMERIAIAAQENGINWRKELSQAESKIRIQPIWDKRNYLNKFRKELNSVEGVEDKINLLNEYRWRGALTPLEAKSLAAGMRESSEVLKRMDTLDEERKFIKRIAGRKYMEAKRIYDDIRDDYSRTRDEMVLFIRDKKHGKAINLAREWNKQFKEMMKGLAGVSNLSPLLIRGSILYKTYNISPADIRSIARIARRDKKGTAFERLLGAEIKK